jgi:hypothetical protein
MLVLPILASFVQGSAVAAAVQSVDPADAEWGLLIAGDATVWVLRHGVPVVKCEHISWAEKAVWVGSDFRAQNIREGNATIAGAISGLDLKAPGSIRPLADNVLEVVYHFTAAREHRGIKGTVLDWRFSLDSQTFARKAAEPVLLDNRTGWTWAVGPNEAVTVRFDEPLDKIIYEANNKNNIRTYLFADRVAAGSRQIRYTIELPAGGRILRTFGERYGPVDTSKWFSDALAWNGSPIDLSFLNAQERPAGKRGLIKADGDRFVFEDGTPARFWGANLAANALFSTPRENVAPQARRMSQLGFNLMRLHQHDAPWATPNIFAGNGRENTRHLDPSSLERLDWWIKCLKDEGIYIWLDITWNRALTPLDGVSQGFDEIKRNSGAVYGFNYFNDDVRRLMQEFQHQYVTHVNRYTKLAYKDDPAIVGVLITNENDLASHFGNNMLPDKNNPVHNAIFTREYKAFARQNSLPEDRVGRTWEPGPSKMFLVEMEHRFNEFMIDDLRSLGVVAPLATTSYWGDASLCNLASLADGDVIDVHCYGQPELLGVNPRYAANLAAWIGAGQVYGKPLSVTEWNVPFPAVDRFTVPLYVASMAALQGWDMPMIYNYSQMPIFAAGKDEWQRRIDVWSTYYDPALCGVMPAAAVAYRQGHISPARTTYCLKPEGKEIFDRGISPGTSATVRTLMEQSKLTIGLPAVKELPWLKASEVGSDATIITDPDHDYIPPGQSFVRSDTGELLRNWKYGIATIKTAKTQAASGWLGGKTLDLGDAMIRVENPKAVVALTSIDDKPLASSEFILITAMARAVPATPNHLPFLSEPVIGTIALKSKTAGLELVALGSDGRPLERIVPRTTADGLIVQIPTRRGTHWYALRTPAAKTSAARPAN